MTRTKTLSFLTAAAAGALLAACAVGPTAPAAALPASNVAAIEVPFRGRTLKVAGDRTFDTWTVTIINDEDFKLRSAFEQSMNGISKLDNNTGATNPSSYMARAIVHQPLRLS